MKKRYPFRISLGEDVLEMKFGYRRQRGVHGAKVWGEYTLTTPDKNPSTLSFRVEAQWLGGLPADPREYGVFLYDQFVDRLPKKLPKPDASEND
jgi:hypothetical protein